jgi:tRNA threonylcarbamoyladenosine modification (KEOPS) complex Cgi121 subunit
MSAAKSLVNYFRDVCPHMLPKKYIGRFTELDAPRELPVYGERKINKTIDGIEYLKEGENVITERLLSDRDLKKIRVMKLREAVKKVDRRGFRSSSEEEDSDEAAESNLGESGESEIEEEGVDAEKAKSEALRQYHEMHSS